MNIDKKIFCRQSPLEYAVFWIDGLNDLVQSWFNKKRPPLR